METIISSFEDSLKRIWKTLALRGLLGIAFGIVLLIQPDLSVRALVLTFGVFAAAHGLSSVVAALRYHGPARQRAWLLVQGAISIGVGVAAFGYPDMTERALVYLAGGWAIALGLTGLVAAWRLPLRRSTSLLLGLDGALSVVFGVVLIARPAAGALALVGLLAALEIATGITSLLFAREVRGVQRSVQRSVRAQEPAGEPVSQS